jgi:hypothetical protein
MDIVATFIEERLQIEDNPLIIIDNQQAGQSSGHPWVSSLLYHERNARLPLVASP